MRIQVHELLMKFAAPHSIPQGSGNAQPLTHRFLAGNQGITKPTISVSVAIVCP
jgi:hypothetical protein